MRTSFGIAFSLGMYLLAPLAHAQAISEFGRVPAFEHAHAMFLAPDAYVSFGLAVIDQGNGWGAWTIVRQIDAQECEQLGHLESYPFGDCSLREISSDGRVAVGSVWNPMGALPMHSIKWTVEGGLQDLDIAPGNHSTAVCVSADGRVIAGIDEARGVYVLSNGELEFAAGLSSVLRITPDGSALLGEAFIAGTPHAVRWTRQGGLIDLGAFHPTAATTDFSVVVGYTVVPGGDHRSVRWSALSGLVPLPVDRFTVGSNEPVAVTDDGGLVVGNASGLDACIWLGGAEAIRLSDYLTERGVELGAWTIFDVFDVTPDGHVFAGSAFHGNALVGYVASVAPRCGSSDFNHDGDFGTAQDVEAFFRSLSGQVCDTCGSSDFNGDRDYGTDQDIEAFFRVLSGQSC